MKMRRFWSFLFTLCMVTSLMAPSGAASLDASVQRSGFAGSTMKCQVILDNVESGVATTKIIEVNIPASATKAQEGQLVQSAALAAMKSVSLTRAGLMDTLSTETGLTIVSGWDWEVGRGTCEDNYTLLIMQFNGIRIRNGATELTVRVTNDRSPTGTFTSSADITTTVNAILYMRESRVGMRTGDTVVVNATTDCGGIDVDSCVISGSNKM